MEEQAADAIYASVVINDNDEKLKVSESIVVIQEPVSIYHRSTTVGEKDDFKMKFVASEKSTLKVKLEKIEVSGLSKERKKERGNHIGNQKQRQRMKDQFGVGSEG